MLPVDLPAAAARIRARMLMFCWVMVAILGAVLVDNAWLFGPPVVEDGDFAANSLLISEAKRVSLAVGNYSKFQFNHPGPYFLYVQALGELLFHDLTGLVDSPFQAHVLAIVLLNSASYALALVVLCAAVGFRSMTPMVLAWAAFVATTQSVAPVALLGWGGLSSTWMPCVYVAAFTLYLCGCIAFARGLRWSTPLLVFAGGSLVHGHVSFALFVPIMALAALAERVVAGRLAGSAWMPERRELVASIAVLALFLAPIVVHTTLNFPGQLSKYVAYTPPEFPGRGIGSALAFVSQFLGWKQAMAGAVALLCAIALAALASVDKDRAVAVSLRACGLAVALAFAYAWRSIDSYADAYTLQFLVAVPMVVIALGAGAIAQLAAPERSWAPWALLLPVLLVAGDLSNPYRGSNAVARAVTALARDAAPLNEIGKNGLIFAHGHWPFAIGVLNESLRRGIPLCIVDPGWGFMVTPAHVCESPPRRVLQVVESFSGQALSPAASSE